jgi:hypothetical protein
MNLDFLPVSLARNGILSSKLFALNNCWNLLKTPATRRSFFDIRGNRRQFAFLLSFSLL